MFALIDRALANEHLQLAEKHVAEGRRLVDAQLALVERLERRGLKMKEARTLLYQFEETLALHLQHRARLAQELRDGV